MLDYDTLDIGMLDITASPLPLSYSGSQAVLLVMLSVVTLNVGRVNVVAPHSEPVVEFVRSTLAATNYSSLY
jgi:hypothetical protein